MQHRSLRSLRSHGLRHARYSTSASPRRRFAVRSAHSCSHTRFARTLARTPCGGHAVYVVSLLLHYPHAPFGHTRIRSHGLRHARSAHASLWSHGLFKWCRFAPNKKTQGYIVSKLLKHNYNIIYCLNLFL